MTMLKTFDLKGNKLSFANWISNLSPCETPFISMIPKEKVDQVQYSWQTDALAAAAVAATSVVEGSAAVAGALRATSVHTNFTQIYRKAVRVSDTTKKVSLYGRGSELSYQMEKAGMEIKRDLEAAILNNTEAGRPGTTGAHGIAAGVQKLIAAKNAADTDTGAVVNKTVTYSSGAGVKRFTQVQVFDMTYQLYLAGSRANKVMVHPVHMHIFSDWIGDNLVTKHVHRMFDGMETKYNAHVSSFRDPLGQVFDIIPNRYMPKNQLFFFNEKDWTQMVLREPAKVELAKNGSSEKHMIEMEVGLRHRNPFASGILEFNQANMVALKDPKAIPGAILANDTVESEVSVVVTKADGTAGAAGDTVGFKVEYTNDDGAVTAATSVAAAAPTVTDGVAVAKTKVKHSKAAKIKVTATATTPSDEAGVAVAHVDAYESRD
ncbi:MAG: SU10 major capsid protein [Clostridium sp.]